MMMAEKERILVVDDEESAREMVSKIVNQIGYEAVTAKNGNEALEILRNTPTTIMITDIKMPETDGLELIKSIRAEFPDTHIICMTGQEPLIFTPIWLLLEQRITSPNPLPLTR